MFRVLVIIGRNRIITHYPAHLRLPYKIRIIGILLELVFNPRYFFSKPQQDFGARLKICLTQLGPVYIKLGQTLSTRPDLIGMEIAGHLKTLQDQLPPFDSQIAKRMIFASFGQTAEGLFSYFDDQPVAAASIAQVHKAILKSGEMVAIKILRPDIHKKYNDDIKLLQFLANLISKNLGKFKRLKLGDVISVFKETMKYELDMRLEAAAASEIADNFKKDPGIYIPKIYWKLTSEDILTTEWIDGTSIYNEQKLLEQNIEPRKIAEKIAVMFFNQAYRDGFFHADLHPGNILVKPDSSIALLDFGIMGRLSEKDRLAIAEILFGFLKRDYKLVAEVHKRVGYIPENTNIDLFAQRCRAICDPIVGEPLRHISIGKLLAQLFKATEDFAMETQPQLLLLQKTMVVVEGIGQSLDPEINMWILAEPWIRKWAAKNISPEAKILRAIKKYIEHLLENFKI